MNDHRAIFETEAKTLSGLMRRRIELSPQKIAYLEYDKAEGRWRQYDWSEVGLCVGAWRARLAREKIERGDRIALLLANSLSWVGIAHAALGLGLVVVPLYLADNPENISYILADSSCKVLLCSSREKWDRIAGCNRCFAALESVIFLQEENILPDADAQWQESALPDDLALIIYTSSTTGRPKGVMLSHHNILWNAQAVQQAVPALPSDRFLSVLPLSHAFELTVGHVLALMAASEVAFSRSVNDLTADLRLLRPSVLIFVPRIYERAYGRIYSGGKCRKMLLDYAAAAGWKRWRQQRMSIGERIFWPLCKKTLARAVLDGFGGRVRIAVSGGASLPLPVSRFFLGLGLPLIQGYGLTEASPVVSCNRLDHNFPEYVGEPLPGVEVCLGAEGELWVKSPSVMLGYWNLPQATNRAIDSDRWLHTGDRAEFAANGIRILGRLNDILVLSTGEKVSAVDMETAILREPLFQSAMVVGNGRPYAVALLVLNADHWRNFCSRNGFDLTDIQQGEKAVLEKVQQLLHDFPRQGRVLAVHLLFEPWTVENALLTSTLKLRRSEIEQHFAGEINAMYAGHLAVSLPEIGLEFKQPLI